ncbi:methyl-accepting chemotaxis protein [Aquabacterium sp. OR-4]|uniref:methyl-accepting chemotaxis protein n=1 Tax=Aquabacterium sp. OR-4 TaxID=2978127 RepID=UPI0028C7FF84|nr:methyl-accepting chemotaxis protein [Aquabacterium sp. OR-4]MDT7837102.1 methyl-accepting chemotaxis protein [Aquabacterium sp. OR-4]
MNAFARLGIAQRLYLVVTAVALALLAVAFFASTDLRGIGRETERIAAQRVPQLERVAELELNVTRTSLQLRHAMLARTPQEREATLAQIGELRQHIDKGAAAYAKAAIDDEERRRSADVATQLSSFWQVGAANLELVKKGDTAAAFGFLVDKTIPARNQVLASLEAANKFHVRTLQADVAEVQREGQRTMVLLVSLVVGVVLVLAVFCWYVTRALTQRVSLAREVTARVRDGDFTQPVHDDGHDEFSPLLSALGEMQTALSNVVGTVRTNAESVATASAEISQGNNDLSQRTEEQASALEQTAATMDQLGSTVRQNAENASQANQLAQSASTVAGEGGQVVDAVVQTMKGINDSSRRIADIIGVIDGIAFQTNILALNAAVEAARAGEQGRGFAVVAGEVRNLAQRSAEAAKEIKSLITASVEQVEQGTQLADKAGHTMTQIVSSIRRVTDIMGEISSASAEQSSGVSQVGDAVGQMDQATQQNAALVEQSAAAAESLKTQAQQLLHAVSGFKLAGQAGRTLHA